MKAYTMAELGIIIARLNATVQAMQNCKLPDLNRINNQGLLLSPEPTVQKTPVKQQEIIDWPVSGMTKGQTFLYRRKNGVRKYTVLTVDKSGKPLTWNRAKV